MPRFRSHHFEWILTRAPRPVRAMPDDLNPLRMQPILIRNARLVHPGKGITAGDLLVRDGRIAALGTITVQDAAGAFGIDAGGRLLTPGLIDIHTHGIKQSLHENGIAGVRSAAKSLGEFGVTTVLPTLIPKITDAWFESVREISSALSSIHEVNIPGLHIEGPFMAEGGAACPTLPGDVPLLERILGARPPKAARRTPANHRRFASIAGSA